METKKNLVFISHANENDDFADDIKSLLEEAKDTFSLEGIIYKANRNFLDGGREWKESLIYEVKESECIVPIFTKNSIKNKWVSFEVGIAEAINNTNLDKLEKIDIFPILTSGINEKETLCFEMQGNNLDSDEKILKFIQDVFKVKQKRLSIKKLSTWMQKPEIHSLVDRIVIKAKRRCVYIIGSKPAPDQIKNITEQEWIEKSKIFLKTITKKLLDRGFHIASFPIVEYVGNIVFHETCEQGMIDNYSIAGIYAIDAKLRQNLSKKVDESVWHKKLLDFRKSYLLDKDFIMIIGGGTGTTEEFSAARDYVKKSPIKFISIPCFDGYGKHVFENTDSCINHEICKECKNDNYTYKGKCPKIEEIVELLLKYEHKDS